jgi:hypothetical protein
MVLAQADRQQGLKHWPALQTMVSISLRSLRCGSVIRACKVVGISRCGSDLVDAIGGAEVRIEAPERSLQRAVQDGDADVEEGLYGPSIPAHLLPLDHPARDDFVNCTLNERS